MGARWETSKCSGCYEIAGKEGLGRFGGEHEHTSERDNNGKGTEGDLLFLQQTNSRAQARYKSPGGAACTPTLQDLREELH